MSHLSIYGEKIYLHFSQSVHVDASSSFSYIPPSLSPQGCGGSIQFCKRGENVPCRIPQPFMTLPQILQIGIENSAGFMDTLGKLIEVVAGVPEEGNQFLQLRQFQFYHISSARSFSNRDSKPRLVRSSSLTVNFSPPLSFSSEMPMVISAI